MYSCIDHIIKHRQISITCLPPTHPRPSQPRYDTDDTDLRDSVWKEAHVTSEYLTIFDTFECWDFLLMASIEQILNEYKYFGNVSRGWRLATSCVLYWRHLHRVWQYDNMTTWQAPPAICVDTEVQLSSLLLLYSIKYISFENVWKCTKNQKCNMPGTEHWMYSYASEFWYTNIILFEVQSSRWAKKYWVGFYISN